MASKNTVEVLINKKTYSLVSYESEEYMQKIASYINNKINELAQNEGYKRLPADMREILTYVNLADDYFKAKKSADSLQDNNDANDKEIYDLKHELVAAQIKQDAAVKEIEELKKNLSIHQELVKKLEAELNELRK